MDQVVVCNTLGFCLIVGDTAEWCKAGRELSLELHPYFCIQTPRTTSLTLCFPYINHKDVQPNLSSTMKVLSELALSSCADGRLFLLSVLAKHLSLGPAIPVGPVAVSVLNRNQIVFKTWDLFFTTLVQSGGWSSWAQTRNTLSAGLWLLRFQCTISNGWLYPCMHARRSSRSHQITAGIQKHDCARWCFCLFPDICLRSGIRCVLAGEKPFFLCELY